MPLEGNVFNPLAKSVLIPLGSTVAASATDAAIYKKMFWSDRLSDLASRVQTLIISNEKMNHIMKIVTSLEESGLLIKGVNEKIKKRSKKKKKKISRNVWLVSSLIGIMSSAIGLKFVQ